MPRPECTCVNKKKYAAHRDGCPAKCTDSDGASSSRSGSLMLVEEINTLRRRIDNYILEALNLKNSYILLEKRVQILEQKELRQ